MRTAPASTIGRRFLALALALLFLLQSAAQAGSGCLPSVLRVRCCCASVVPHDGGVASATSRGSKSETTAAEPRSCCASKSRAHAPMHAGHGVASRNGCQCQLAPLPSAPSDAGTSWTRDGARDVHVASLLAQTAIAVGAVLVTDHGFTASLPATSPPGSPPGRASSATTTRLAQRGVIGLLSDLGTFLE
jgi:hypothetical protein